MSTRKVKPQTPEEMLLRLIRVAEILIRNQSRPSDETTQLDLDETPHVEVEGEPHKSEILR